MYQLLLAGNESEDEAEMAKAREIHELGSSMTSMQSSLSGIKPSLACNLLSCLQVYISKGDDAVLPIQEDVSRRPPLETIQSIRRIKIS